MRIALLFLTCLSLSCTPPDPPGPLIVRPSDLARSYRESPRAADLAYKDQIIRLPMFHTERKADKLVWSLGTESKFPPVIVFEFDGDIPRITPTLWIEGRCEGMTTDSLHRELPGYDFTIRVSGCRVIPPPAGPPPNEPKP